MGKLNAGIVPVTPFEQNCTILFDDETREGVVVDPGGDVDIILSAIRDNGLQIKHIWITHGHIDHAGGAMDLKDALGVDIIGPHEADRPLLENLEKQALRFGLPGGVRNCVPDRFLNEGETVSFGDHIFEVLHCPGHAPGHVVYFNRAARFRACGRCPVSRIGRTNRPAGRRPRRTDRLDQGKAAAARRRHRLSLRPRSWGTFRRGTPRQSVPGVGVTPASVMVSGAMARGLASPRRTSSPCRDSTAS